MNQNLISYLFFQIKNNTKQIDQIQESVGSTPLTQFVQQTNTTLQEILSQLNATVLKTTQLENNLNVSIGNYATMQYDITQHNNRITQLETSPSGGAVDQEWKTSIEGWLNSLQNSYNGLNGQFLEYLQNPNNQTNLTSLQTQITQMQAQLDNTASGQAVQTLQISMQNANASIQTIFDSLALKGGIIDGHTFTINDILTKNTQQDTSIQTINTKNSQQDTEIETIKTNVAALQIQSSSLSNIQSSFDSQAFQNFLGATINLGDIPLSTGSTNTVYTFNMANVQRNQNAIIDSIQWVRENANIMRIKFNLKDSVILQKQYQVFLSTGTYAVNQYGGPSLEWRQGNYEEGLMMNIFNLDNTSSPKFFLYIRELQNGTLQSITLNLLFQIFKY